MQLAFYQDLQNGTASANQAILTDVMNGALADAFALYVKTKNFHWHMWGPHFRDYHLMLDEQATQILAGIDAMAERVRKRGAVTIQSIGDISRRQSIIDCDTPSLSPGEMLQELRDDNLALAQRLKGAKALADEAGDNVTSALLDDWTEGAEQRAWFLTETTRT